MLKNILVVPIFSLLLVCVSFGQTKQGDWTYLESGQNALGVQYRADGIVLYANEIILVCDVDPENKITISTPSKIKGLSIVHCLRTWGESSAIIIDTKAKKRITKDIVPKEWRLDPWFSWSPDESYLVCSPRGEVTNGDMFFVDTKIGRTTEIHFKDFTNKNPLEAQEFIGSSFSWIKPTTYKLRLDVFCNIYEMDEKTCDPNKTLRSYNAQVNVVTLAIAYGLPSANSGRNPSYKKTVPKKSVSDSKGSMSSFSINRECGWGAGAGCKEEIISFRYDSGLEISAFLGDTGASPSLRIVRNKNTVEYFLHNNPLPHFLESDAGSSGREDWHHREASEKTVAPDFSRIMLNVYKLAEKIAFSDLNTQKKRYTEIGQFAVLEALRNYSKGSDEPTSVSQFMPQDDDVIPVSIPRAKPTPIITRTLPREKAAAALSASKYGGLSRRQLALIASEMISKETLPESCKNSQPTDLFESAKKLTLSPRGEIGYEIYGQGCACLGARRCGVWIVGPRSDGFVMLADGGPVDGFAVRKSVTNGYYDLRTTLPDSFLRGIYYSDFKFNGSTYDEVASGCIPLKPRRGEKLPKQCAE